MSIDESEEPEGNFVSVAYLDVVDNDVAVGQVGNLWEAFLFASHLKNVVAVYLQISLFCVLYRMTVGHHGREEGLASGSFVGNGTEGIHEVGIVEEYLVGLAQCFETFVVGMELADECCTLKK